jgi:hypothetical protein
MPNHVHLILVPTDIDGLRQALAAVHRRYAGNYGDSAFNSLLQSSWRATCQLSALSP